MQEFLDSLVSLLPLRFQRVAKALVPFVVAFVAALVSAVQSGVGWRQAFWLAAGAVASLAVHRTRNAPEPDRLEADLSDLV